MADKIEPVDGVVSLEQHAAEKAGRAFGSVHDYATRKEAIDCAVNVARTTYDLIAKEHSAAMAELERQVTARVRGLEARLAALEGAQSGTLTRKVRAVLAWARGAGAEPANAGTPPPGAVMLPPVMEFEEWGSKSDHWLAQGYAALGPDYLHPGPNFRRLRCRSTDDLRAYAEALGGDPDAIADGETSKAVEGEVLDDVRKLIAGEIIKRSDTKPEAMP